VRIAALPPSRRVWIFDLDNTLHDARARIFPAMHDQINAFLQRHFGIDEAGANRMREHFWRTYGTTLNGLMRHHGVHPRQFLAETHVFPELADLVVRENALKHALERLGGTKIIFSNAPRHYVGQVLDRFRKDPTVNPFNITNFQSYLNASASKDVLVITEIGANGAIVPLCQPNCPFEFSVFAFGPQLVVDIVGYFKAPGPPSVKYVDNGDGTVTDNTTGLMWEKKLVSSNAACTSATQASRDARPSP